MSSDLLTDLFAAIPQGPSSSAASAAANARRERNPEFRAFHGVVFHTKLDSIKVVESKPGTPKYVKGRFTILLNCTVLDVEAGVGADGVLCDDETLARAKLMIGREGTQMLMRHNAKLLTVQTKDGRPLNYFAMREVPGVDGNDDTVDSKPNEYSYPDMIRVGCLIQNHVNMQDPAVAAGLAAMEPAELAALMRKGFEDLDAATRVNSKDPEAQKAQALAATVALERNFNLAALNPALFEEGHGGRTFRGTGIRFDVSNLITTKDGTHTYVRVNIGYTSEIDVALRAAAAAL